MIIIVAIILKMIIIVIKFDYDDHSYDLEFEDDHHSYDLEFDDDLDDFQAVRKEQPGK